VIRLKAAEAAREAEMKAAEVFVWGSNISTQCDFPTSLTDVVEISGGGYHSLVIKKGQQ
jgi:hypothetical protein